jgi:hypothetical protein
MLPKYVRLVNTEMRLEEEDKVYYRHAGMWEVQFKKIKGLLVSWCPDMEWLHKKPLIEITEDEWKKK